MFKPVFQPAIVSSLKEKYNLKIFTSDLLAGVIIGIVALPLSIAFAIASGVDPQKGLITAFVAGLAISAFSGSRFQIGGPTGAFIVIIYGVVQKYGYDGLAMATMLAGIILVIMGLAKLGDIIKFIPYPVTVGFTAGIAVVIFTSQIKDLLGISGQVPESFYGKWIFYFQNIRNINISSVLIGLATIFILIFWPKVSKKIPAPLVAILLATAAVKIFNIPSETIFNRFGQINCSLHMPAIPHIDFGKLPKLFGPAMTIALLAGIESLLSAVVADGMTGTRHKSNTELIGQGLANILSPIFGGIPATGAIARTAVNIKNGGRTPIAGAVHSIVILCIFLFLGRWAELIPLSALAGVIVIVAWNMGEWHLFAKISKAAKSDFAVLLTTFLLTIFIDLTVAIEAGLILASFLFMQRMTSVTELGYTTKSVNGDSQDKEGTRTHWDIPAGIEVFEIEGPFFFGAAMRFRDTISEIEKRPKVLILRMQHVPTIDATGLNALEEVVKKTRKLGTTIILAGIRPNLLKQLKKAEITGIIKEEMIVPSFKTALKKAKETIEKKEKYQKTLKWLLNPDKKIPLKVEAN